MQKHNLTVTGHTLSHEPKNIHRQIQTNRFHLNIFALILVSLLGVLDNLQGNT